MPGLAGLAVGMLFLSWVGETVSTPSRTILLFLLGMTALVGGGLWIRLMMAGTSVAHGAPTGLRTVSFWASVVGMGGSLIFAGLAIVAWSLGFHAPIPWLGTAMTVCFIGGHAILILAPMPPYPPVDSSIDSDEQAESPPNRPSI